MDFKKGGIEYERSMTLHDGKTCLATGNLLERGERLDPRGQLTGIYIIQVSDQSSSLARRKNQQDLISLNESRRTSQR